MKCQNCGTELETQAKFCTKCGNKVEEQLIVQSTQNNEPSQGISAIWPEWQIEEKPIGRGSYGVVYKAIRRDNNVESHAAIKIISIPSDSSEVDSMRSEGLDIDGTRTYFKGIVDDFVSEIQLMESLKGVQNIVSVEDYKVVEKQDTIGWDIYIRMELLTPFNTYICDKTITEEDIIKLGTEICTALEICGQRNIIHRDIKPENIFVNDFGYFKLGDFGIARKLENMTGGLSQKGTFNYMAPEVANSNEYDARVDTYSLGIVLYRLLNNNRLPFLDNDKQLLSPNERKKAVERRMRGENLPAPCNASPEMANLILRACAFDPNVRFTSATEMKQALLSIANGTYTMVDHSLERTTSVRSAGVDCDDTTAVRKAMGTDEHGTQSKVGTFGDVPKEKSNKGKKIKIIAISVLSLIGVIAIGIFTNYAINAYKDSSETNSILEKADNYYENGDYENAITEYSKVAENSKNYEEAQNKLNQVYVDYISSTVEKAKKHNSSKDYKQAVQVINTAYDILPDSVNTTELDSVKEESLAGYKTEVANEVTELTEDEKWAEAFKLIDQAISFDDNEYFHNLNSSTEDDYVKSVTETVNQHLGSEDYVSAKRVAENALTILPGNEDLKELKKDVEDNTPVYLMSVCKPYSYDKLYEEYINGETFSSGGQSYSNGFVFKQHGYINGHQHYANFNLNGSYTKLTFALGHIDGTTMSNGTLKIYMDGVYNTEYKLNCEALPQKIVLDITGVKQLKLEISDTSGGYGFGNITVK